MRVATVEPQEYKSLARQWHSLLKTLARISDMETKPTPKEIWVDRDMKRCDKQHKEARHATYNEEYEMYVIDH